MKCTKMDDIVEINLRGTIFKTSRSTLKKINGSYLANLDDAKDKFFFDKDPFLFRHILNAHRECEIHVPRDVCPLLFKKEILFWNLPLTLVSPCCWKYLYGADKDVEIFKQLNEENMKHCPQNRIGQTENNIKQTLISDVSNIIKPKKENKVFQEQNDASLRIWLFLDKPGSSTAAKIWFLFYIFIVVLSVAIYIIWLEPSVRVSPFLPADPVAHMIKNRTIYNYWVHQYNEKMVLLVSTDPHKALFSLELLCVVFFSLEAIVHFIVCPQKCKYFINAYNLLKIFLCVGMMISTFFEFRKDLLQLGNYKAARVYYAFKSCCVLRLLLILKLHEIYESLHIMFLSLRNSVKELLLLLFSFFVAVIVYGCLIFSAEIESTMFPSTQISMWWSLITMTTIGFGDFYPTTTWGYIVGVFCAVNGVIVLALPIAAIASTFSSLYSRNADLRKHLYEVQKQLCKNSKLCKRISNDNDIETICLTGRRNK